MSSQFVDAHPDIDHDHDNDDDLAFIPFHDHDPAIQLSPQDEYGGLPRTR
jgi:hypothetical protein